MNFLKRIFGGNGAAKRKFLKRIQEANIYEEGRIASTYGYTGRGADRAAGPILAYGRGSRSELSKWITETLRKGGTDAARFFAISMKNNHINFCEDRGGRYGFAGSLTKEAHIWVVRTGPDDYEWVLWEFIPLPDS